MATLTTLPPPATAPGPRLVVAPDLAEEIVWRALVRAERAGRPELRERHQARAAAAYALPVGPARERAFTALARRELEELDLLGPIRAAVAERPALRSLEIVLLARALGPSGETVTCDPPRRRVGLRVGVDRFDDPTILRSWTRHVLGHAEDSLDPAFAFDPGWEGRTDAATAERLHVLWDAAVDGRAARTGRPVIGPTRDEHRERLVALLPPGNRSVAAALVDRCWSGERPDFPTLRRWAEAPLVVVGGLPDGEAGGRGAAVEAAVAGGSATRLLPGGRCPLCRCPSVVLHVPEPVVAAVVAAAHPGWGPQLGCCERCHDRYRLAPPPSRAAGPRSAGPPPNPEVLR